jgi:uncharacterized protein (DUF58 family)
VAFGPLIAATILLFVVAVWAIARSPFLSTVIALCALVAFGAALSAAADLYLRHPERLQSERHFEQTARLKQFNDKDSNPELLLNDEEPPDQTKPKLMTDRLGRLAGGASPTNRPTEDDR